MNSFEIKIDEILAAAQRISKYVQKSPLVYSYPLSEKLAKNVFLKLESQNPTNSFKVRPAFNNLLVHEEVARKKGVLASSSGNFAQAVAYASRALSIPAKVVMTSATSPYKVKRTEEFGAEVFLCGPTFQNRLDETKRLHAESGRLLLQPSDSVETITGDGSVSLELLAQLPDNFTVLVPTSGGGLLAGMALTLKLLRPDCEIIGVQPKNNGSMKASLTAGRRVDVGHFSTVADALISTVPGELTFEIVRKCVDNFILIEEEEIKNAVRFLFNEQKIVAEPGGAIGVAALLTGKAKPKFQNIVSVISGGNISPDTFKF